MLNQRHWATRRPSVNVRDRMETAGLRRPISFQLPRWSRTMSNRSAFEQQHVSGVWLFCHRAPSEVHYGVETDELWTVNLDLCRTLAQISRFICRHFISGEKSLAVCHDSEERVHIFSSSLPCLGTRALMLVLIYIFITALLPGVAVWLRGK